MASARGPVAFTGSLTVPLARNEYPLDDDTAALAPLIAVHCDLSNAPPGNHIDAVVDSVLVGFPFKRITDHRAFTINFGDR